MARLLERCSILKEILESQSAFTQSEEKVELKGHITQAYAEALYETVLQARPMVVLEVGMAFGVSSLAILTALSEWNKEARLISIDPNQSSRWKGGGRTAVARAGFGGQHELIEDYDYAALPRLLASGLKLDFAYIDGWHTFDYTLLDWWYIDRMLAVDGIVGFNDCGWPAVDKALRFVLGHRKYTEIDVGLPVNFAKYSRKRELLRILTRGREDQWFPRVEDRYFKKNEHWEPKWDFFAPF